MISPELSFQFALLPALGGLGIILWLAANWGDMGRPARFALLQGVVVVFCAASAFGERWRAAFART